MTASTARGMYEYAPLATGDDGALDERAKMMSSGLSVTPCHTPPVLAALSALTPLPEPFGRAKFAPPVRVWIIEEPVASHEPRTDWPEPSTTTAARPLLRSCVVSEPTPSTGRARSTRPVFGSIGSAEAPSAPPRRSAAVAAPARSTRAPRR